MDGVYAGSADKAKEEKSQKGIGENKYTTNIQKTNTWAKLLLGLRETNPEIKKVKEY